MDGTLIDSEPYWFEAQADLVARFGGTWSDEEALELVGAGLWLTAEVMQRKGCPWDADAIVDHLTDAVLEGIRREVPWRPGARELLSSLRERGVTTGLVTMSIRRMATEVAEAASQHLGGTAFDVIVSGDDVTVPKPDPEAYLLAAERLDVEIRHCVAIEDSPTGLSAAVASGAASIGVPLMLPIEKGPAHTLWPTLDGRTPEDLAVVLAEHAAQNSTGGA